MSKSSLVRKGDVYDVRGLDSGTGPASAKHLVKSQLITVDEAQGTTLYTAVRNATSTFVRIVVVLMYSIDQGRIYDSQGKIQLSGWLELSENSCARTRAHLAAAERIGGL